MADPSALHAVVGEIRFFDTRHRQNLATVASMTGQNVQMTCFRPKCADCVFGSKCVDYVFRANVHMTRLAVDQRRADTRQPPTHMAVNPPICQFKNCDNTAIEKLQGDCSHETVTVLQSNSSDSIAVQKKF
jgi:hypothetical protein